MPPLKLNRLDYAAAVGMFAYAASVVATPIVLLQIADELAFGLAEGGGIEAVRAGFLLAILIVSGIAAGRFGKTRTLTTGAVLLSVGLVGYAVAPSYVVVLAAIVLVGLGGGILEALLNPLIQDEHPRDSGRYLNFLNAFFSVGVLSTVLVVGELLTRGVSWRILIGGIGSVAAVAALLFGLFGRGTVHHRPHDTGGVPIWSHARGIVRDHRFGLFAFAMFCGGGAEGAFTYWIASYVQLGFGVLPRGGAVATAAFAGGMVVGRIASGHIVRQEHLHRLIIASAVLGVIASVAAWAVAGFATFIGVVFLAGLTIACFWPSIQSYAAAEMGGDSTVLFILLSCGGIPGFGLASWIMGLIAVNHGLRASLLVIPVLLVLLALVMVQSLRSSKSARV